MPSKVDCPIFIVGTPRSGTTLTSKILGRHSNIFMPGETHFFDDIFSLSRKYPEPFNRESRRLLFEKVITLYARYNEPNEQEKINELLSDHDSKENLIKAWHTYRDILSSFMELQMLHEGKSRWGNNTPRDIFHINSIVKFYPKAKFIICVRDIRDFLSSYKFKWRATAFEEVQRLKKLYHPVLTSWLWKSSIRRISLIKSLVKEDDYILLRYEDLVKWPEECVHTICETIGEAYEPQMLNVDSYASSYGTSGKGIFSGSVGKWQTELQNEEVKIAQDIASNEMEALGYMPDPLKVDRFRLLILYSTFPLALIRALWANRFKHGPLIPYIMQRLVQPRYKIR